MKNRIVYALLILIGFVSLIPACSKTKTVFVTKTDTVAGLKDGLVLYLPFTNGSYADSSGLNNTVTAVGGASLGYDMHGYPQSAYNGTGNGAYLMVANNGSYKVDTAFAVSFDFMTRALGTYSCCGQYDGLPSFVSIVDVTNGNGPTFNAGFTLPGFPHYFAFGVNGSRSDCDSSGASNTSDVNDTCFNFNAQTGGWYNAVVQFSHGTLTTYINGVLVNTQTGGPDSVLFCPNANFVVGGWWGGHENMNGELDEIRMYNHTLNAGQIAWLSRNFQPNSTGQGRALEAGQVLSPE
jgi:hypothetical protein